ncbi:FAD-dependent tricarballylate dehydrogenase TcuA [Actinomadura sp. LOL_016]|uniref:FAD-dependent tricarballylate dehydrogenase TcuA n=1 Tax=unclassified Actinomadura TaxID=2626254 RepID=UPI003A7FDAC2
MGIEINTDVVVVGGGNAALTAAIAAAERGRSVVLLERAPEEMRGGNSYFTAGATRIAHDGLDDLLDFVDPDERHGRTTVPPYPAEEYRRDLERVTEGRNDPALTEVLIAESAATLRWLHGHGARYRLMYERQAYDRPDGSYLFWGGLHVGNTGGGAGLVEDLTRIALRLGVDIRYEAEVTGILRDDAGRVVGVRGEDLVAHAESVILGAGGFESDPGRRRAHLGEGWENAKVRGTPFNDGRILDAALAIGAGKGGDWSTCHSVQWDAFAESNESNFELTNRLTRQSYPMGIIVNREGRRFLDEGADFRNYTYAKYGRLVLQQPGSVAWQIFDRDLRGMLRTEEYDMPGISVEVADSIPALADRIGVPAETLARTVEEFNRSIDTTRTFDPTIKDGRIARTEPVKSNWSKAIGTAPYYAYGVTCGITFTFGGLRADTTGRVLDETGEPIPGLFVCGEMLGGLFSGNYPGGTGLAAGGVFGRRAGTSA